MPFHWYIARSSPSYMSASRNYDIWDAARAGKAITSRQLINSDCTPASCSSSSSAAIGCAVTHLETVRTRTVTETLLSLLELLEETETPRDCVVSATPPQDL